MVQFHKGLNHLWEQKLAQGDSPTILGIKIDADIELVQGIFVNHAIFHY